MSKKKSLKKLTPEYQKELEEAFKEVVKKYYKLNEDASLKKCEQVKLINITKAEKQVKDIHTV